jgi:RimJ/RimL family protein N-acetyltransferase
LIWIHELTKYKPIWPIHTERLLLRPFEDGDLHALFAMQSDEEVVRYLYHDVRTLDGVRDALARKIAAVEIAGEGDGVGAAAVLRESGEVVADLSLWCVSEAHAQGELGFVVHPAHQRKGYATEASRALLAFAFDTVGFHRVVGRTEARNIGSARVLEKLGMRREAHLIENEWVKGEWQSELIYAMLAEEWGAIGVGTRSPQASLPGR